MNLEHHELQQVHCDRREIGQRIRKIRLQQGLSQDKFAESINISPNFLCELENGRKGMSFDTLCRIARIWNTTTDYLLLGITETSASLEHLEKSLSSLCNEDIHVMIDYLNLLLKLRTLSSENGLSSEPQP